MPKNKKPLLDNRMLMDFSNPTMDGKLYMKITMITKHETSEYDGYMKKKIATKNKK